MSGQPWLFKWRQFEAEIIVCAVRWYLRYSLSYREVQELLAERGSNVDHSTISGVGCSATHPSWRCGSKLT